MFVYHKGTSQQKEKPGLPGFFYAVMGNDAQKVGTEPDTGEKKPGIVRPVICMVTIIFLPFETVRILSH